ncbi:hypothetical protein A2U01_0111919, partial [Trifolium medium]|nr:hypothetical protein [Trifolium medium]
MARCAGQAGSLGNVLELACGARLYGALRSKAVDSKNRLWNLRVAQSDMARCAG